MSPARSGPGRLPSSHQEAVDRRLALLHAEIGGLDGLGGRDEPPPPAALPVPGRHAARRPRPAALAPLARAARVLPGRGVAGEPGPWALGSSHLTVVAVVSALALALTTWWVVRSTPTAVPLPPSTPAAASAGETTQGAAPLVPGALPTGPPPPGAEAASSRPAGAEGEVVVHVAGDVRRPGLVVLPVGSRVADAVEAAGGARRGADLAALNLARPLVDGEQVLVGADAAGGVGVLPGGAPGPLGTPGAPEPLVDLNTADQALLETLPGVGPVTAAAILDWRAEHGGFTAVEELLEVDGIGEATLEDLAPLVTV